MLKTRAKYSDTRDRLTEFVERPRNAGTHTITAVPSNDRGNGNTITAQITVRGVPAQPSLIQGLDTICTVQGLYTVAPQTGITYNWTLGSGGVITPQGNAAVTILWTNAGTHTIIVTPQDACGTLGTPRTKTITVQIPPQLTQDISGATQVCNGEPTVILSQQPPLI